MTWEAQALHRWAASGWSQRKSELHKQEVTIWEFSSEAWVHSQGTGMVDSDSLHEAVHKVLKWLSWGFHTEFRTHPAVLAVRLSHLLKAPVWSAHLRTARLCILRRSGPQGSSAADGGAPVSLCRQTGLRAKASLSFWCASCHCSTADGPAHESASPQIGKTVLFVVSFIYRLTALICSVLKSSV